MKEYRPPQRYVDGLVNPRVFHRPATKPKWTLPKLRVPIFGVLAVLVISLFALQTPQVQSVTRQIELLEMLSSGRYLVLFQNDAEIRASGGFIGSFAIVEAKNRTLKPIYVETNPYKLDTPFTQQTVIEAPKPFKLAIGNSGWALRDSNFAADFTDAAPTVAWFFEQETKKATGPKKVDITRALGDNYSVDGVIGLNLSGFLDILKETGPITLEKENITLNAENFFPIVQQIVEKDYFTDPNKKAENEPKTILKDLMPIVLAKIDKLPRLTQYRVLSKLLQEKKVVLYSFDKDQQQVLIDQGWADSFVFAADKRPKGKSDFLGVIRTSLSGNKSSVDINPIYRYSINPKDGDNMLVKLDITFEHTGKNVWPSGPNHEYLRVIAPEKSVLTEMSRNGKTTQNEVDIGTENNKSAFGFWLHTDPGSSQTISLSYSIPKTSIQNDPKKDDYQIALFKQPGGKSPDVTVTYSNKVLYQGRLSEDRLISAD
jgi:hypothetical protein